MSSHRISSNRKRSALSSIANVHPDNNNKRIKLDQNPNISSASYKRINAALSSITNVHPNNKRAIIEPNQNISSTNCKKAKIAHNTIVLNPPCSSLSAQSSSRPLHLNHLPFDCFYSIFQRITLQNRITRLSLVCRHWKSTVDEMCHQKGELTINLFSSFKPKEFEFVTSDLEHYLSNARHERMESLLLKNRKFSPPDLSVRFPLITHLVIRSNDTTERQNCASLQLFTRLLGHEQEKLCLSLTSLTLHKLTKITDPTYLPKLCSAINQNSSNLTQLNLYIQSFGPQTCQSHPERVMLNNILPKLERYFVICSFANWVTVMRSLGNPTSKVRELDLCEDRISPENLSRLLSLTRFTSTVTHLHLTVIRSREWFSIICDNFGLLQFLQINVDYNKFNADWFNDLRKLSHLTEFKMHDFQLDPTTVNPVPLPTVKKLTICNSQLLTKFRVATDSNRFNASQYCRLLSHHFPSVSVLILLSNEKRVKVPERNIRKWTQVHFKHIEKVVLVLKAEEFKTEMKVRWKFMKKYHKSLLN